MCLAFPGRVDKMDTPGTSPRYAEVNSGGLMRRVCIDFLPDLKVGDYVVVHVGYAIEIVKEEEAEMQLKSLLKAEEIIRQSR